VTVSGVVFGGFSEVPSMYQVRGHEVRRERCKRASPVTMHAPDPALWDGARLSGCW
jgi:hypothetical protein